MSVLVWDAAGSRRFEAGASKGVFYTDGTGLDSAPSTSSALTTNKGYVWNGLTSVSESPSGADPNDIYADDMKYATLRSAETFGGTIEAYTYPDQFMECDGSEEIVPGVYAGQQGRKSFGFCYRSGVGDDNHTDLTTGDYKLHIIYNATVSPSERQYQTINDSPDAMSLSWELTTVPLNVTVAGKTLKPVSCITIDTSKLDATGKTNLATLEGYLYGTADMDAFLPSPSLVMSTMKTPAPDSNL